MEDELKIQTLMSFLEMPLDESDTILNQFKALPSARPFSAGGEERFVYVPGSRPDRVLLVAHADTVWREVHAPSILEQDGVLKSAVDDVGIGADDRAGCAILWWLRKSGHSLLITDGEEHGKIGANYLMNCQPQVADEINQHAYMLQLDRKNSNDCVYYNIPVSEDFKRFIQESTGYMEDQGTSTDIVALCRDICVVNLSIGYYNEHSSHESLVIKEWLYTLETIESLLSHQQAHFDLAK